MLDVTVKTLDGKNRSFSVPDDITIRQFKEKISSSIEIAADSQRLIFQGRVLQDEKLLNDYDVNGKTLHVVMRPPPSSRGPETTTSSTPSSAAGRQGGNTALVTSFTLPADPVDPNHLQNLVQNILSGLGNAGRNARVSIQSSGDGSQMDVHINLGNVAGAELASEARNRLTQARRFIRMAHRTLDVLENPPGADSPSDESPSMETDLSEPTSSSVASERLTPGGASSATASGEQREAGTQTDQQTSPGQPPVSGMSDLLQQLLELNQRLQPHLDRYHAFMRDDPTLPDQAAERDAQRVVNMVSEVLHFISHVYHHISDMMVSMRNVPPRHLTATPVPISTQTAVIQQTVPVQINVAHGSPRVGRRNPAATSTSATSSTTTSRTASSTSTAASAAASASASTTSGTTGSTSSTATSSASAQGGQLPPGGLPGFPGHFPGFPLPPNVVPMGAVRGNGTPGNPFVFMGVGPNGSLSLDSLSAEIITDEVPASSSSSSSSSSASAATNTTSSTAGATNTNSNQSPLPPFLSPGILQNLIQNSVMRSFAPPQGGANQSPGVSTTAPPTSSATPPPTSSTAASSSANPPPQPGQPRGGIFVIPGMSPPGMPRNNAIDPFLACHSRHFMVPRLPRAGAAATSATATSQQSTTSTASSSQGGMAEQALAGVVGQIVHSLLGGQGTTTTTPSSQAGPVPTARAAGATTTNPPSAGQARPPPGQAPPPHAAAPNMGELLSNLMQGLSGNDGSDSMPAPVDDPMYSNIVQSISHAMSSAQGGRSGTIADIMDQFGLNSDIQDNDGLLAEVLQLLSNHLTYPDLMMIFFGVTAPIARLRVPLQRYIRETILRGEEASAENIQGAVQRLVNEMGPDVESMCTSVTAVDCVDFKATVNEFFRHHLTAIIQLILNATESDRGFPQNLYDHMRRVVQEFLVLSRVCLQGGSDAVEQLIQNRVRHMTSSQASDSMQQWTVSRTSVLLRQLASSISVSEADVQRYIQRVTTRPDSSPESFMSAESGSDSADAVSMETTAEAAKDGVKSEESMDVDETTLNGDVRVKTPSARSRIRQAPELDETLLSRLPPPPRRDELDADYATAAAGVGSADWQRAVPADWVPVIARDIRRQQREPPQPPFSDAYINGMSSKRRKLMAKHEVENQLRDTATLLPQTIAHAVESAGVHPHTSMEEVKKEASQNETLNEAFSSEIKKTISERVRKDSDFIPEKYPNSDKYYKE